MTSRVRAHVRMGPSGPVFVRNHDRKGGTLGDWYKQVWANTGEAWPVAVHLAGQELYPDEWTKGPYQRRSLGPRAKLMDQHSDVWRPLLVRAFELVQEGDPRIREALGEVAAEEAAEAAEAAYESQGIEAEGKTLAQLRGRKVWLYTGTTSGRLDAIRSQGLIAGSEPLNFGATGQDLTETEAVFLTARYGNEPGGAADYARRAASRDGTEPVVLRVLVDGDDLEPDPDDQDVGTARFQYTIDGVAPEQIMEIDGERVMHKGTRLEVDVLMLGEQLSLFQEVQVRPHTRKTKSGKVVPVKGHRAKRAKVEAPPPDPEQLETDDERLAALLDVRDLMDDLKPAGPSILEQMGIDLETASVEDLLRARAKLTEAADSMWATADKLRQMERPSDAELLDDMDAPVDAVGSGWGSPELEPHQTTTGWLTGAWWKAIGRDGPPMTWDGLEKYMAIARADDDPERLSRKKRQAMHEDSPTAWKGAMQSPVEEWKARFLEVLADGKPRTFNALLLEASHYEYTADVGHEENPEKALWALVEEGILAHTPSIPVRFGVLEDTPTTDPNTAPRAEASHHEKHRSWEQEGTDWSAYYDKASGALRRAIEGTRRGLEAQREKGNAQGIAGHEAQLATQLRKWEQMREKAASRGVELPSLAPAKPPPPLFDNWTERVGMSKQARKVTPYMTEAQAKAMHADIQAKVREAVDARRLIDEADYVWAIRRRGDRYWLAAKRPSGILPPPGLDRVHEHDMHGNDLGPYSEIPPNPVSDGHGARYLVGPDPDGKPLHEHDPNYPTMWMVKHRDVGSGRPDDPRNVGIASGAGDHLWGREAIKLLERRGARILSTESGMGGAPAFRETPDSHLVPGPHPRNLPVSHGWEADLQGNVKPGPVGSVPGFRRKRTGPKGSDPKLTTEYHHESGWVIRHAGHATAIHPYYLQHPDHGDNVVVSWNGMGFSHLRAAMHAVEALSMGYYHASHDNTEPGTMRLPGVTGSGGMMYPGEGNTHPAARRQKEKDARAGHPINERKRRPRKT